jgi:hypothetical protein
MVAVAITLVGGIGYAVLSAHAEERHDNRRVEEHRDYRAHRGYGGGYYNAPPIIYDSPCGYYGNCAPPVIYGPGVGIMLPGIMLNIH